MVSAYLGLSPEVNMAAKESCGNWDTENNGYRTTV